MSGLPKPGDSLPVKVVWECDVPGCTHNISGVNLRGGEVEWDDRVVSDMINTHYANQHPGFREAMG